MKQTVNPATKPNWGQEWKIGLRVWIEREGQAVLGAGRAELLAAIESERSITKAAKMVGMSYRRAWTMIQEVNKAAGEPLVEAAVGGKQGGGARLTPKGRAAVEVYDAVRQSLTESAASALGRSLQIDPKSAFCIHLAAAISLQEAIGQVLAEFALREPTVRVRAIFGASNELADQLLAGSPGDILISADPAEFDRLEAAHLLVPKSQRTIARNGLAVIGRAHAASMKNPADLLAPRFKRIVLAEPACPLGQYSKDYLAKIRIYEKLLPKVLQVDNSRAVLAAVASGAAQAGVAFASDSVGMGNWKLLARVPASQAATAYAAAMIRRGKLRHDVQRLRDFLSSPVAKRCYRRCGLAPLDATLRPKP